MTKYRITADQSNTDEKFVIVLEAINEDSAWTRAEKKTRNRLYNGKVEELPTREELIAERDALREAATQLLNTLPVYAIEMARDIWGNTNMRIITEARQELAALLKGGAG